MTNSISEAIPLNSMTELSEDQDHHEEEDFGIDQLYSFPLPVGYRFLPTDEELVTYLMNKVNGNPIPDSVFQEMTATEFYGKPPHNSVQFRGEERECFLFIHEDNGDNYYDYKQNKRIRIVGDDGLGFWQSNEEKTVFDVNGNVSALKIHLIYFKGSYLLKPKKTLWKMDEYRLPIQFYTSLHHSKEKWAVGRITRGKDYNLCC